VLVALAFGVVMAPWLLRNAREFGDPFYTDLRTDVISDYPGLGGIQKVWASVTPPPRPFPYMLTHVRETALHFYGNLRGYMVRFPNEALGSVLLLALALIGVGAEAPRWRRWVPPLVYGALLTTMFTLSTAQTRYLFSLIPLCLVLAASGLMWMADRAAALPGWGARVARAAVMLLLLATLADELRLGAAWASDRTSVWEPGRNACALQHQSAAPFILQHTPPSEAIMVAEPYHAAYLFDRPVVNLPYDERFIAPLCRQYGIRYLVVSDRERAPRLPGWSQAPPPWARVVWRSSAEEIGRTLGVADYRYLSPVTIYELTPAPQ
jgi:hypothetical protein